ncbi:MAG: hypothetical protein MUF51_10380, partial [Vicinamibacteria bacterium]|nr:hypothetical protein [Vicinamibacteria bacterium]
YQLDGRDSELRSKGLGLRLRHVLGPGSVGEVALRYRDRRFTQALEDNHNNTGSLWSLEASSAKVVAQTERLILRFEPQARAGHVAGADSYFRASARLGTRLILVAPGKEDVEPGSSIQGQAVVAWGSRHLPIDEVYAPGFGPDMDYPLRGHAQLKKGVQGIAPLSERIGLVNLEWRHWVIKKPRYRVGGVLGTDYAYLQKLRNLSSRAHLLDIGVGLRLFLQANTLIRIDYGRGLFDQSQALSTGMGHSF